MSSQSLGSDPLARQHAGSRSHAQSPTRSMMICPTLPTRQD